MEFESTIEKGPSGMSTLTITVPKEYLEDAVERAKKALNYNLKVLARSLPGGEEKLRQEVEFTQEALEQEATERLVQDVTKQVIRERSLRLIANPQITLDTLVQLDKPYVYRVDLELVPELELRDYHNLEISVPGMAAITDSDVLERIGRMCKDIATLVEVERPIASGDTPVITLRSFVEGDREPEVTEGYSYELGSLELPEEFEDELVGMKAGEEKEFGIVVPADFHNKALANKSIEFKVLVEKVQCSQIPLIDNDLAIRLGYTDYQNLVSDMRSYMKNEQREQYEIMKEQLARREFASLLVEEVPSNMIEHQAEKMLESFKDSLGAQDITIESYCSYLGITQQSMLEDMKTQAEEILRENLALEALFRQENLVITESEMCGTLAAMQDGSSGAPVDIQLDQLEDEQRTAVYEMTLHRLATEWIFENITFVDE